MKKSLKVVLILLVIVGGILIFNDEDGNDGSLSHGNVVESNEDLGDELVYNNSAKVDFVPAVIYEEGWSEPKLLGFNDGGWEDSPYITSDGKQILFFYHPWGDLLSEGRVEELFNLVVFEQERALKEGVDPKVYYSDYPFNEKHVHWISQNKSFPTSEACPFVASNGDVFFCGNRDAYIKQDDSDGSIYRNFERLDFNTGGEEGNPHYCEELDEMWFDCPNDDNICYVSDVAANGWKGTGVLAPYPINMKGNYQDFQPFLTDDCMELYFTSNRDGQLKIYRSSRLSDGWSEPEVFISHEIGVGEFTMTSNRDAMTFVQISLDENGVYSLDVWYSEKE